MSHKGCPAIPGDRWWEKGPCRNYACPHNIFSDRVVSDAHRGAQRMWDRRETPATLDIGNCDREIEHPFSLTTIAEIYGVSKQNIDQVERRAITHFAKILINQVDEEVKARYPFIKASNLPGKRVAAGPRRKREYVTSMVTRGDREWVGQR